jgi:hypothetical protein
VREKALRHREGPADLHVKVAQEGGAVQVPRTATSRSAPPHAVVVVVVVVEKRTDDDGVRQSFIAE